MSPSRHQDSSWHLRLKPGRLPTRKVRSDEDDRMEEIEATPTEKSPLLFINHYREGPIIRRSGPDRTTVGVHVQRTIRKKKQHDIMMRLNSRELIRVIPMYHGVREDADNRVASPHQHSIYPIYHPLQTPSISNIRNMYFTFERNLERQFYLQRQAGDGDQIAHHRLFAIPTAAPPSDAVIPSQHPRSDEIALKFFLETLIPRISLIPSQGEEHVQWVLQRAVMSPALYFAITAAGAAGFRAYRRNYFPPYQDISISQYEAILSETMALKHLRLSLDAGETFDSVVLIYVITCLMVTKIFNGDKSAIQVHASALSRLTRNQEARTAISIHVVEVFISSCYKSCIITGQPPAPAPSYPVKITKSEACSLLEHITTSHPHLADLGQAFFDPFIEAAIGPELLQLLRNKRAVTLWCEYHRETRGTPSVAEMTYFYNLSWHTHFTALNRPFAKPARALYECNKAIEEPCRIALLIFCNASDQVYPPASLLHRNLASQLETAFKEILATNKVHGSLSLWELFDEHSHDILLWILLLGAFTTYGMALGTGVDDSQMFFVSGIAQYQWMSSKNSKSSDWKDVEGVLERFLYSTRAFRSIMKQRWVEALALAAESSMHY